MTREGAINCAVALRNEYFSYATPQKSEGGIDASHLCYMVNEMRFNQDFSTQKIMRWLGYIQGVLVTSKVATLEDMKNFSKRFAT